MISKQCQIKLDSLALTFSGKEATNFKETLLEIEEFCELPEDDESISKEAMADNAQFKLKIKEVLTQLDVEIQYSKLLEVCIYLHLLKILNPFVFKIEKFGRYCKF